MPRLVVRICGSSPLDGRMPLVDGRPLASVVEVLVEGRVRGTGRSGAC